MRKPLVGELIAEALGTAVIILFGAGSVAMVQLFGRGIPGEIVNGGYTNITIAWGLGVALAIYLTARVSGAHLNPAVTVSLAAFRNFPGSKVVPYCLAQTVGAFLAAAIVYLNYRPAFLKTDPELVRTAGIFTTFPAFPDLPMAGLIDQVIGTALLVLLVFALTDDRNLAPLSNLGPAFIGLLVIAIGMSFGAMHGYAINPARDLGPRLFTVIAGFRNNGITDGTNAWVVPIVGPLVGGLIGGAVYDFGIRTYLPPATVAPSVSDVRNADPVPPPVG
jgi:glycerol uptake facilitator protein